MKRWLKGILGAFIHGAASAALSWSGMAAAHGVGVDVPLLNWKGLGVVLVAGGLPRLFSFLNDHPLPDDTELFRQVASVNPPATNNNSQKP